MWLEFAEFACKWFCNSLDHLPYWMKVTDYSGWLLVCDCALILCTYSSRVLIGFILLVCSPTTEAGLLKGM